MQLLKLEIDYFNLYCPATGEVIILSSIFLSISRKWKIIKKVGNEMFGDD